MKDEEPKYESIGARWTPDSYSNITSDGSGKISNPALRKHVEEVRKKIAERKRTPKSNTKR